MPKESLESSLLALDSRHMQKRIPRGLRSEIDLQRVWPLVAILRGLLRSGHVWIEFYRLTASRYRLIVLAGPHANESDLGARMASSG